MKNILQILIMALPLLLLSQDTFKEDELIAYDTIKVEIYFPLEKEPTVILATEDLKDEVELFLSMLDLHGIDKTPFKHFEGIFTVNYIYPYTKNENVLGLTLKAYPEADIDGISILKLIDNDLVRRTLVFHELTHVMTYNELPHCKDAINCSSIFYTHLQGLEHRMEKYWDMEVEKLANMIKIYQKYDEK